MLATKTEERGLLIVHTGTGKGKSTAAFGMVLRCLGHGMRVGIVQFVKGTWETGERPVLERFADLVTCRAMGEGFTWDTQDRARDIAAARAAWETAQAMIGLRPIPRYDLVVLDELNIVLRYDYLPLAEVRRSLAAKPRDLHVVVTGRNAKPELDRDRRSRHRDDHGEASLPRRDQGAEGDRVLMAGRGPHAAGDGLRCRQVAACRRALPRLRDARPGRAPLQAAEHVEQRGGHGRRRRDRPRAGAPGARGVHGPYGRDESRAA